jgi:hypothetical protein
VKYDSDKVIDITELRKERQENVIDVTDYIEERLRKSDFKKNYGKFYNNSIFILILINQAITYFILFYLITNS